MHPIERLRYVARAGGVPQDLLVQETASALATFGRDPQALVTACRRMIARQPGSGPLVWLSARMLTAPDPRREANAASALIADDPTGRELAAALPDEAVVTVVGCVDTASSALVRRGDVEVLAVGAADTVDGVDIPPLGLGAAVADSDLVLVESTAIGPEAAFCPIGSRAAAATAGHSGIPVWLVGGVGRLLPRAMWEPLVERAIGGVDPWDAGEEVVPLDLVDRIVGPDGPEPVAAALTRTDCPVCPELFRGAI